MSDTSGSLTRFPTGIDGLDIITTGGFLQGGVYIVQGTPGTGKTTFANQVCFNHVKRGGRALYTTLLAEYHERMLLHLSGMSFFDEAVIPEYIKYINGFGTLREGGYSGLRDLLRREIAAHGASVLILDGFAAAMRRRTDEQDFNEFVHDLQVVAIATGCTMFLLTSAEGATETPEYTIVDGIMELNDQLIGWSSESTLQIVKLRGSAYLRGRHAFRITSDGIVVYPRIEALLPRPSVADGHSSSKVGTGSVGLDTMLGGGFPASSATIVIGPTGVGKTTLGLQFLTGCSEAEPGLFFSFYKTPERVAAKADAVCTPLRGLIDSGAVELIWQPPTDGLLDGYGAHILSTVQRCGIRRLVIDDIGALQNAAVDPVRLTRFLTALINELRALGVTSLFTLMMPERRSSNNAALLSGVFLLSDNLVELRYVNVRARLYRLASIIKVRSSHFDPTLHAFTITERGLEIEETSDTAELITDRLVRHDNAAMRETGTSARRED